MAETRKVRIGYGARLEEVEVQVPDGEPAIWDAATRLDVVGTAVPRLDGPAKVTGRAKYTYDVTLPGMLFGKILRSPHPHARIVTIDTSKAARLAGVKAVITFETPEFFAAVESEDSGRPVDEAAKAEPPAGKRRVLFAGEEVAAVAATTQEIAEDALHLIEVKYEPLPHVVDLDEGRKPGAPRVFPQHDNTLKAEVREQGDVEAGFKQADQVVEGTYRTPVALHNALEPHGAVARWEGKTLTVWASTQGVFGFRDDLAKFFKIPPADVRVITEYLGGGFGAKFGAGVVGATAALLARRAQAPVKLMLDRHEENLATGNRPSSVQWIKVGAKRDGTLTAIHLKSYGSGGIAGGAGVSGPIWMTYACPNLRSEEQDVLLNTGFAMPFRAPGFPQGSFALESALDELADRLGLDPLDLRRKNYIERPAKPLMEQYALAAKAIGWERRQAPPAQGAARASGKPLRGLGMGTAVWPVYGGPPTEATVKIHTDGAVECICGTQDIGTGTRTAMAIVTAEVLGLKPEQVRVTLGDTGTGMYSPASGGSVTLNSILPAVRAAAEGARQKYLKSVAPALGAKPEDLDLHGGRVVAKDGGKSLAFAQGASRLKTAVIAAQASRAENYKDRAAELVGAQFAEVEVDPETGRVRVLKVTAAHECGRVINRLAAESQVNGGVIMGLSYALLERRVIDSPTGNVLNANLEDYKVAGTLEMPEIVPILVEVYDPANSIGVKGLGEPPVVPTAAAIANAVSNALGVRMTELPLTPDRILAALAGTKEA
ncbi:MAG TPA: xanthine dehydrogenase family protein molybdopterin-binding subunit [Candidatus Polarisedimenticolia bacterium]|nr:xanthine dehydrogenase family protein molybdopterin-binding subunit [Candidatus Polarisedimenticolia bacterium]